MLHLICCVRAEEYIPIERYQDMEGFILRHCNRLSECDSVHSMMRDADTCS